MSREEIASAGKSSAADQQEDALGGQVGEPLPMAQVEPGEAGRQPGDVQHQQQAAGLCQIGRFIEDVYVKFIRNSHHHMNTTYTVIED